MRGCGTLKRGLQIRSAEENDVEVQFSSFPTQLPCASQVLFDPPQLGPNRIDVEFRVDGCDGV